jgi:guanine deaminase
MLKDRTILAHGIWLDEEELKMIKEAGASISHCPNSNTSIQSGIMPCKKYLDMGMKVGLGTDVAGGYSTSMFDAIRNAIGVSKLLSCCLTNYISN